MESKLIEKAVNEIAQLPGIGKRSALAGVAFIETAQRANCFFAQALVNMREDINIVPTVIIYQIVLFAKSVLIKIETTKLYVSWKTFAMSWLSKTRGNIEGCITF
jgi:hypothetical protein